MLDGMIQVFLVCFWSISLAPAEEQPVVAIFFLVILLAKQRLFFIDRIF